MSVLERSPEFVLNFFRVSHTDLDTPWIALESGQILLHRYQWNKHGAPSPPPTRLRVLGF